MYLSSLQKNFHLTITLISLLLLFAVNLFISENSSMAVLFFQDIVALVLVLSLSVQIKEYIRKNKISFLSLSYIIALLLGVLLVFVLTAEMFTGKLVQQLNSEISLIGLSSNIIGIIYLFFFAFGIAFLFVVFKEYYFSRRTKFNRVYFRMLNVFGILSALTFTLFREINLSISTGLMIVSILLIIQTSLGISWIAFLTKKEKYRLLIVSVAITTFASVLIAYSSSQTRHSDILMTYSIGFYKISVLIFIYAAIYFGILFFTVLFHLPTAEAFDRKAEEVSTLHLFSSLINQVLDFDELTDTITDLTKKVSRADASWFVLKSNSGFYTISQNNILKNDADKISHFLINSGDNMNSVKTGVHSLEKSVVKNSLSEQFSSVIVAPLKTQSETKGYLFAARKSGFLFFDDEVKAVNAFSDYASIALENSRLLKESIEKERLEKELDVAREMQKKLLPAVDPDFKELKICSVFIPAFEVGGDFYDYYSENENEFSFVIGDVAGKGISAAFVMAEVKGIFESLTRILSSPKEILIKANQILLRTLHRKNFVSALFGKINLKKSEFEFARAGHCPAILIRDGELFTFQPKGLALGLDFTDNFAGNLEQVKLSLKKNDTLIFYTDGVTESKNKFNEDFGEERFIETIKQNSDKEINLMAKEIISQISLFANDSTQYDDITLLILRWNKN